MPKQTKLSEQVQFAIGALLKEERSSRRERTSSNRYSNLLKAERISQSKNTRRDSKRHSDLLKEECISRREHTRDSNRYRPYRRGTDSRRDAVNPYSSSTRGIRPLFSAQEKHALSSRWRKTSDVKKQDVLHAQQSAPALLEQEASQLFSTTNIQDARDQDYQSAQQYIDRAKHFTENNEHLQANVEYRNAGVILWQMMNCVCESSRYDRYASMEIVKQVLPLARQLQCCSDIIRDIMLKGLTIANQVQSDEFSQVVLAWFMQHAEQYRADKAILKEGMILVGLYGAKQGHEDRQDKIAASQYEDSKKYQDDHKVQVGKWIQRIWGFMCQYMRQKDLPQRQSDSEGMIVFALRAADQCGQVKLAEQILREGFKIREETNSSWQYDKCLKIALGAGGALEDPRLIGCVLKMILAQRNADLMLFAIQEMLKRCVSVLLRARSQDCLGDSTLKDHGILPISSIHVAKTQSPVPEKIVQPFYTRVLQELLDQLRLCSSTETRKGYKDDFNESLRAMITYIQAVLNNNVRCALEVARDQKNIVLATSIFYLPGISAKRNIFPVLLDVAPSLLGERKRNLGSLGLGEEELLAILCSFFKASLAEGTVKQNMLSPMLTLVARCGTQSCLKSLIARILGTATCRIDDVVIQPWLFDEQLQPEALWHYLLNSALHELAATIQHEGEQFSAQELTNIEEAVKAIDVFIRKKGLTEEEFIFNHHSEAHHEHTEHGVMPEQGCNVQRFGEAVRMIQKMIRDVRDNQAQKIQRLQNIELHDHPYSQRLASR